MSRMAKEVRKEALDKKLKRVENFMGGYSYELNPLDTLKIVSASSIFGEPQYYRHGEFKKSYLDTFYKVHELFEEYSVLTDKFKDKKTSEIMEIVIDEALSYDFKGTLDWAIELRYEYYMRLNPQVIMVRAACHKDKEKFIKENPGEFNRINQLVMSRADEPMTQFTYYLYRNKSHKNLPNILKRGWAKKISSLSSYEFNKYKSTGLGMKDIICVCHPKSEVVDEFMKTGKVSVSDEDLTWEILRSEGKSWEEIINTIRIPHMALLRNLRGIFSEISDKDTLNKLLDNLKDGVLASKQYPFRYLAAYNALLKETHLHNHIKLLDTLEECMDIACDNMPKLKGKTMCLSDNSGSAWGTFNSEYGSVTVAEIGNLSSVIAAKNSDDGYVGKFGDLLKVIPVSKRNGILMQSKQITENSENDVGGRTENGIWIFFDNAIKNKEHWDNIFVYSDMQAGHGGLYGINEKEYADYACGRGLYIDVNKLINKYRSTVNPKVNVFMIQTAGYTNVLVPEYGYRTNILTGWTGKEAVFASEMIDFWNVKDLQAELAKK